MMRKSIKKRKGISAVVATVLLTVIGIAGVVLFWTVILPMFYRLDFQITDAKLTVVKDKKIMQIEIWNTGSIDIKKLTVEIGSSIGSSPITLPREQQVVHVGEKKSIVVEKVNFDVENPNIIKVRAEGDAPFGGTRITEKAIIVSPIKA
jgi:FlaG/FlaF family flagellin (archaellin)